MFGFLNKKKASGKVGLEVRPDGLAYAVLKDGEFHYGFEACSAAERADTLKKLVKENSFEKISCRVVLPSDQYKTYSAEKPQVEEAELVDAVRWKIKDLLDFDVNDAVMDVYDFPEDALRGRPAQVNVVVARRTIIQNLVDLVEQSGMELEAIDVADLSLRNVALKHGIEEGRSAALLYLRRGAGVLVFIKDKTLYLSRQFDFSLDALNDVAQQDNVIQYLALEIQRSFDYFESQLGQIASQELVLIGPDPDIPLANMIAGSLAAKIIPLSMNEIEYDDGMTGINCLAALGTLLTEKDE